MTRCILMLKTTQNGKKKRREIAKTNPNQRKIRLNGKCNFLVAGGGGHIQLINSFELEKACLIGLLEYVVGIDKMVAIFRRGTPSTNYFFVSLYESIQYDLMSTKTVSLLGRLSHLGALVAYLSLRMSSYRFPFCKDTV